MKYQRLSKTPLLSFLALGLLLFSSIAHGEEVELREVSPTENTKANTPNDADSPAWHRSLWDGSFDTASDASGAAAKQLENLNYGDCQKYMNANRADANGNVIGANEKLFNECNERAQNQERYAKQVRGIQSQQQMISVVSKASDVAAVGAVGATIYGELGMKNSSHASSYEKAAKIQKKAGQVNYVTGAADFTMGAYAYVAQKNQLESLKNKFSGKNVAGEDPRVAASLMNAADAAKKAAYNHMMVGAGKMAAGYASVWLSKRTADQGERMKSIQELKDYNDYLMMQQQLGAGQQQLVTIGGSGAVPFYQNNTPTFSMGTSTGGSASVDPSSDTLDNGTGPFSASGASIAPTRGLASNTSKNSVAGSSRPSGSDSSGSPETPAAPTEKETADKEAIGSSFETHLTGGVVAFSGSSSSSSSSKDEVAHIPGAAHDEFKAAATGLNPGQMYNEALEGTEGMEQGSMAGVNGKGNSSVFEITKQKLMKMFHTGNVGVSKNVEVKE